MIAFDVIVFGILSILTIAISVLTGRSTKNYRYAMGAVSGLCVLILMVRSYQTQTENTKLQERLVDLAKETREEVTGGDSFCYVEARELAGSGGLLQVSVLGKGKNPLSGVNIRIVDLDEAAKHPGAIRKAEQKFEFCHRIVTRGF
jgi:hypothetical protein